MLANLCVESYLRDLIENGFEVIVVSDAVGAPNRPELGDDLAATTTNFGFIANDVITTAEAVRRLPE
ncbi:isochorismatase family protein [Microbacterium sp. YMB-B2]|uniref:Isochorismatase family protein n=1 Tax=Microbacterium tenebrionis TaxID=2830665 RepID=A0A9X1LQ64_9MICO|nr:isochorismatase family protein [Microbacterium tenebrionis]MCC2030067.1 isochorismatase family protein [Microbacterium tenebrionis]